MAEGYDRRASFQVGRPIVPNFRSQRSHVPEDEADEEMMKADAEKRRQEFDVFSPTDWAEGAGDTMKDFGQKMWSGGPGRLYGGAKGMLKWALPIGDTGWGSNDLTHKGQLRKYYREEVKKDKKNAPFRTADEDLPTGAVRWSGEGDQPISGQEGWDREGGGFRWSGSGKPGDVWKVYDDPDFEYEEPVEEEEEEETKYVNPLNRVMNQPQYNTTSTGHIVNE